MNIYVVCHGDLGEGQNPVRAFHKLEDAEAYAKEYATAKVYFDHDGKLLPMEIEDAPPSEKAEFVKETVLENMKYWTNGCAITLVQIVLLT